MMRLMLRSLVLALLGAMTAFGQTAPSAENSARAQEILKLARAGIGDESKLSSLRSLSVSGSSRRILNEREQQSEVEFEVQFPDKIRRSTVATPFPGAEFQNIEVINGDQVWFDLISSMPPGVGFGGGRGPGGPGGPGGGGGQQRMGGMQTMMGDEATRQVATRAEFTRLFLSLLASPPPNVQVEYSVIGEAKAPDGVADVIEVKGPGETRTRLFVDRTTHRILMLSYKGKDLAAGFRGRGGPGGGAGPRPQGAGQPGQAGQAGQGQAGQGQAGQGQAGQPPAQPQLTPEEREQRRLAQQQRIQEAIAKAPDVEFFWRFADYKSEGGLNLPRLITRSTGDRIDEEWQISKVKVNANIKPDRFEKKDKK